MKAAPPPCSRLDASMSRQECSPAISFPFPNRTASSIQVFLASFITPSMRFPRTRNVSSMASFRRFGFLRMRSSNASSPRMRLTTSRLFEFLAWNWLYTPENPLSTSLRYAEFSSFNARAIEEYFHPSSRSFWTSLSKAVWTLWKIFWFLFLMR